MIDLERSTTHEREKPITNPPASREIGCSVSKQKTIERTFSELFRRKTTMKHDPHEDDVVNIKLVGKRKVYSESAYNRMTEKCDRLRQLVKLAYREGYNDAYRKERSDVLNDWEKSSSRTALHDES